MVKGICFCTFLCKAVMLADFQADWWPRANDRGNVAERGWARAAEQVFRRRELMPSSQLQSRIDGLQKLLHLLRCKSTESRSSWIWQGRIGKESKGLGVLLEHCVSVVPHVYAYTHAKLKRKVSTWWWVLWHSLRWTIRMTLERCWASSTARSCRTSKVRVVLPAFNED